MRRGLTLALVAALAGASAGCGDDAGDAPGYVTAGRATEVVSASGAVVAQVTAVEAPRVGRNAFELVLDPGETQVTGVSTFMPAHGHGGPSRPRVVATGGTVRIEDAIFNMAGLWDIRVDLELAGESDRLTFSVDVP